MGQMTQQTVSKQNQANKMCTFCWCWCNQWHLTAKIFHNNTIKQQNIWQAYKLYGNYYRCAVFFVMVHARKAYQHLVHAAVKINTRHAASVLVTIRHIHWHLFVSKKALPLWTIYWHHVKNTKYNTTINSQMSCNNRSPYSHPSCTSASDACTGAMSSKSNTCRRSSRLETAFYLYMRELFSPRSNTSRVNPRTEAHIKETELMAALKHSGTNNKQLAYKMLLNIEQFVIYYDLLSYNLTSSGA